MNPENRHNPVAKDADRPPDSIPSADSLRGVPVNQLYPVDPDAPKPPPVPETPAAEPQPAAPKAPPEPKTWREKIRSMSSAVIILLLAPLIAWSISTFALQSYQVNGQSMERTLQDQDRLIVNKLPKTFSKITHHGYVPHRGDILIINNVADSDQIIKRVIGLPGERVVIKANDVTIYNQASPKGFNPDQSGKYSVVTGQIADQLDLTLGSDEIFVMGDNRPNSKDSRYLGPFKLDAVVGKVVLRIMPFNKTDRF